MFKTINIYPQVVKVAKKASGESTVSSVEPAGEQPVDPLLEEVPEEERVPEEPAGDGRVPEYTMVKKATTRKAVRK